MAEPVPDTRIRMPWVQHGREWTGPWMRVIACVGLAALSGCDALESDGLARQEYRRVLVEELCAPGEFYSECVWTYYGSCYEEMPYYVGDCIPFKLDRVHPSAAFRESVLECVFNRHFLFPFTPFKEREGCLDATRWRHILPAQKHKLATFQQIREEDRRKQQAEPATTDPLPEPSPGAAPEPSPGTVPDQAPAP